jgi:predicted alpha/beta hydrolase family esterase
MVNCIILHGCPSDEEKAMDPERRTHDKHWIPWLKNQLEENGIKVSTPLMPKPWSPDYESWKNEFDKLQINEETILIGHSCASAFLVRYLGDTQKKVKKLILVAPWILPSKDYSEGENKMYDFKIDESIKNRLLETIIFTSDDEEEDGKKSAKIFHEALNGKVIELKKHGHFTLGEMETEEFPELLEEVLK